MMGTEKERSLLERSLLERSLLERSLLVVDDEGSLVDLISYFLRLEGFDILRGRDGIDAFSFLCLRAPLLMLLDMCLPCITGLEVITQVRRDRKTADVPIVAMSGDSELLDRAMTMGADAIIAKPFTREKLLEIVARYMRKSKARVPPVDLPDSEDLPAVGESSYGPAGRG